MRRTKIEAILVVVVVVTLALTAAALGYYKGRSSTGVASPVPHPAVPESYTVPQQIPVLCFHGIGTPSPVTGSVDNYNTTLANFTAEMAYLHGQGYATITPQQYTNWLYGIKQLLPAKPILLTFDDAFVSDTEATPVLEKYGFSAVLFVITGYANGGYGSAYAGWSTIQTMAGQGWMIQLHAGECGHAFLPYAPASCTAGLDRSLMTSTDYEYYIWPFGQTDAQYQARVVNDITVGQAAIQTHLNFPAGWQSTVFAAPFGAWGNGENRWLISYWDSLFKTVFVQYIAAADQVAARADHVRYRLELGYGAQSATYLQAHLSDPAFTRAGAGSAITSGAPATANG
jgi:peptidoglycan/xylan/chitin deacetylase (PgdA/CDA1 family)